MSVVCTLILTYVYGMYSNTHLCLWPVLLYSLMSVVCTLILTYVSGMCSNTHYAGRYLTLVHVLHTDVRVLVQIPPAVGTFHVCDDVNVGLL